MNLVFTGFMGTGKSKTGRIVSERLKRGFFDTDNLIERKVGYSINDIFKRYGETSFRQMEIETIKEVSERDSAVISCGGGVVLNSVNIAALRKKGIIINLYASAEVIYERLKSESDRPLLRCEKPLTEIKKLLNFRKTFYMDCDFSFDTDGLSAAKVADKVLNNDTIKKLLL
ncbi:shikimate kinase [Candidatus Endomicrobiellum agilis]|uniref:shikimate kinase n=1 Tax=Candidatus Endomicrobiellum agilis TaxID=3238957 RepID=UPI003576D62E|nr:shikimate kinase [Endomicrobium sp.]